jgi:hypothetical protein
MTSGYDWQKFYRDAVLETDWSKIEEHIEAAESAIDQRLREFSLDHGGTKEENQAILDTLDKLKILRKDVASWRSRQVA